MVWTWQKVLYLTLNCNWMLCWRYCVGGMGSVWSECDVLMNGPSVSYGKYVRWFAGFAWKNPIHICPKPLPVIVYFWLTELYSLERNIMLKRFYELFAHSIYIKNSLWSVRILFSKIENSGVLTTVQPCIFRCSSVRILLGVWVIRIFHHLFSSPEINSNKSRWTWHIEWMEKNRTHTVLVWKPQGRSEMGFKVQRGEHY